MEWQFIVQQWSFTFPSSRFFPSLWELKRIAFEILSRAICDSLLCFAQIYARALFWLFLFNSCWVVSVNSSWVVSTHFCNHRRTRTDILLLLPCCRHIRSDKAGQKYYHQWEQRWLDVHQFIIPKQAMYWMQGSCAEGAPSLLPCNKADSFELFLFKMPFRKLNLLYMKLATGLEGCS